MEKLEQVPASVFIIPDRDISRAILAVMCTLDTDKENFDEQNDNLENELYDTPPENFPIIVPSYINLWAQSACEQIIDLKAAKACLEPEHAQTLLDWLKQSMSEEDEALYA